MKWSIASFVVLALVSGCTLTGVRSGSVQDSGPSSTVRNSEPDHLGDPTFERETVRSEPVAGYEREVPRDAVVSREATAPEPENRADLVAGLDLYEQGRYRDARQRLTRALDANLSAQNEAIALSKLRSINERIFLSTGTDGDLKTYKVEQGDFPARIAQKVGTTWELIVRLNGLTDRDIRTLQIGRELKVPKGTFELHVRKSKYVMDLLLDGQFIQRYEVGLGVGGSTPLGEYTIRNRIPKAADGAYPYGHPQHRLGTRWMGIHNEDGYNGYGIHGCRPEQESEIPGECSQGCIRMTNAQVEEVFDIVPVGTRVRITQR